MNKQELIKKIADKHFCSNDTAEMILASIEAEGWLRNPGEPIDPKDIRKGDRVRIEYVDNTTVEKTMKIDELHTLAERVFLLDRPKPELPTEPGSVIRARSGSIFVLDKNGRWWCDGYSVNPRWFENVDWEVVA